MSHIKRISENFVGRFGPCLSSKELCARMTAESEKTSRSLEVIRDRKSIDGELDSLDLFSFFHEVPALINPPKDREERKIREFWAIYNKNPRSISSFAQKAIDLAEKQYSAQEKACVDLGCGNSGLAPMLLQKGWTFHAVDSSPESLIRIFENTIKKKIDQSKLTINNEKMEEFVFPEKVTLVTAQSSFPYVDPSRFQNLWDRIHTALIPGGYIAGNMFVRPLDSQKEEGLREKGIWFADAQVMKAFAKSKDYQILHLSGKSFFEASGDAIQFIFQKRFQ